MKSSKISALTPQGLVLLTYIYKEHRRSMERMLLLVILWNIFLNKATIKLTGQEEEITLEGEAVFGEMKFDLKRKSVEGDCMSRRLRRRG